MIKQEMKKEELEFVRNNTDTGTGGQNPNPSGVERPLCLKCWYYGHSVQDCKTNVERQKYKDFRNSQKGKQREKEVEALKEKLDKNKKGNKRRNSSQGTYKRALLSP